ncbi:acid phosphatase/Vanadium-dependent haloperoxidase [Hesseltinella vesiculosa]|uniref:Acid phosphatase/Vanadium-dependent haloperoxidase n=1 Tax=Hesseltinella vesiculosa TaxID=101127 RepID=A0A1X2GFP5_9FUNG|nr:acid phosphatase/Vanadium-dependent haloperoxidase [Hesseltinella vesiculosa]
MAGFWNDPQKRRITASYVTDWVVVILIAAVFLGLAVMTPYRQEFSLNDITLQYPYTEHESVPSWLLGVIALVIPFVLILLYGLAVQKSVLDANHGLLGLCLALALTAMLIDVTKNVTGRPRPDLLARCQIPSNLQVAPYSLVNYTVCTTDPTSSIMKDGFRSFPSGHSAYSFAGLGFLSLYFSGKLHLFDRQGCAYKAFVFWFPLFAAFIIAMTRVRDYRHHWADVLVGGTIGYVCAQFCYHLYYPPLTHQGQPFRDRLKKFDDHEHNALDLPAMESANVPLAP